MIHKIVIIKYNCVSVPSHCRNYINIGTYIRLYIRIAVKRQYHGCDSTELFNLDFLNQQHF